MSGFAKLIPTYTLDDNSALYISVGAGLAPAQRTRKGYPTPPYIIGIGRIPANYPDWRWLPYW